ncbi:MAG: methionine--tRNA ligase, partial [Alphaproteobacteria bacterium]|nr:methionine--tRNA ligase [Alphaproteobacteria bacterium]
MPSKHLITSAFPYINGIKHLGNLVGSMLPADVYARFLRQSGEDVLFICATDDHGTPAELGAIEEHMPVADYCDKQHALQASIYERFALSFDFFGRTSSPENAALTRHFCESLEEQGLIERRTIKQIYSIEDQRFLPDRYIVGTCPHCNNDGARGDQCESCSAMLDPEELIDPRSAISGSSNLEVRETDHLFLRQSAQIEELEEWLKTRDNWSPLVNSIAQKWLREGLRDRCITRDLDWGIKVNKEGLEDKVFYVWFDAPIGYISATQQWANQSPNERNWREWWCDDKNVSYVQFMAKDNIPFHTISFPCTLLGSNEPWKTVDNLKGFNWLTYDGGKFSTSQKRGVFLDQALEEFPADYFRYWLLANAPESSDSDFSWKSFAQVVNKDLADVLGNFVVRTIKFVENKYEGVVPPAENIGEPEKQLIADLNAEIGNYSKNLQAMEYRKAMRSLRT